MFRIDLIWILPLSCTAQSHESGHFVLFGQREQDLLPVSSSIQKTQMAKHIFALLELCAYLTIAPPKTDPAQFLVIHCNDQERAAWSWMENVHFVFAEESLSTNSCSGRTFTQTDTPSGSTSGSKMHFRVSRTDFASSTCSKRTVSTIMVCFCKHQPTRLRCLSHWQHGLFLNSCWTNAFYRNEAPAVFWQGSEKSKNRVAQNWTSDLLQEEPDALAERNPAQRHATLHAWLADGKNQIWCFIFLVWSYLFLRSLLVASQGIFPTVGEIYIAAFLSTEEICMVLITSTRNLLFFSASGISTWRWHLLPGSLLPVHLLRPSGGPGGTPKGPAKVASGATGNPVRNESGKQLFPCDRHWLLWVFPLHPIFRYETKWSFLCFDFKLQNIEHFEWNLLKLVK